MSPAKARALAEATSAVDFEPNSQAPENAHMHAMTGPGLTPLAAQYRFFRYIDGELRRCTPEGLAGAIHAAQDYYAGGHKGFQTYGGFLEALSPFHFVPDFMPSPDDQTAATMAARNLIRRYKEQCLSACR
jgi:hypothetical protein